MEPRLANGLLWVDLGSEYRCLSSAVLGGGLAPVRTWVNLQVPSDYARTDPAAHVAEVAAGFPGPLLGMLTAASVERFQDVSVATARVFATVGLGHPVVAAGPMASVAAPLPGTINLFVVSSTPLTAAGLAGALQTAVEAKVQALAAAGVPARNGPGFATGTASDAIAVACPRETSGSEPAGFAGPATPTGSDLARAVYEAVLAGCLADEHWRRDGC